VTPTERPPGRYEAAGRTRRPGAPTTGMGEVAVRSPNGPGWLSVPAMETGCAGLFVTPRVNADEAGRPVLLGQLDGAQDVLARQGGQLMADGPNAARVVKLARVWQTLFEHARSRLQWRAALAAEARGCARHCRRQAEQLPERLPAGLLLVCGSCQRRYELNGKDLAAGRAGCPDRDCGGWTFVAELVEPAAGGDSRKAG
jgi:hypothetical protein